MNKRDKMSGVQRCRVTHSRRTGTCGGKELDYVCGRGVYSVARYWVFGCRGMSEKARSQNQTRAIFISLGLLLEWNEYGFGVDGSGRGSVVSGEQGRILCLNVLGQPSDALAVSCRRKRKVS